MEIINILTFKTCKIHKMNLFNKRIEKKVEKRKWFRPIIDKLYPLLGTSSCGSAIVNWMAPNDKMSKCTQYYKQKGRNDLNLNKDKSILPLTL